MCVSVDGRRLEDLVTEAQRMVQPTSGQTGPLQPEHAATAERLVSDLAKRRKMVADLEAQRGDPLALHKYQAYQDYWRLTSFE
jgi:hypothetical protein